MCMKSFNEVVATHLNLESVLMPIDEQHDGF
ncbi:MULTISPECIES: methyltransferase [Bacillus cereus group]|nr:MULTISPECIES: methyltransferase [Bacillus cereus group]MEB9672144.1 methyltransferase [Bacillus anthracis]